MVRSQITLQSSAVTKRRAGTGHRVPRLGAWGRALSQTGCPGMLPKEGTLQQRLEGKEGSKHVHGGK